MNIDVTMTAVRRPELVAITLASFYEKVFLYFPVRTFFLNIDPVWGDAESAEEVERIVRGHFDDVVVRKPDSPSFGGAVKWLWSQPRTEWFLHMEDDWILSRPLTPSILTHAMRDESVAQIRLANWKRLTRRRRPPTFTTSPVFTRSDFGASISAKMDPCLDPEKQFRNGLNPDLMNVVSPFRAVYYGGMFTPQIAFDIGRGWRDKRKINKHIINGESVWTERDI
jgi:hypothetical protein